MVIMMLERVPPGLRGELSRWMLEPKTNVFVGRVPAIVRDKLWERVCDGAKGGAAMLVHSADTEQGFAVRMWGVTTRSVVDHEGIHLVHIPE